MSVDDDDDEESSSSDSVNELLAELARAPARELSSALGPGTAVGRFVLVRQLGRGGFGIVYEARDSELGRHVAVKIMRIRRGRAAGLSQAHESFFKKEAEAAARLNHPNVVTLYDFGTLEGRPYLILELVTGETLAARLLRGPIPVPDAIRIMNGVLAGLGHAHHAGVIHRDLKPSNVMVTDGEVVKVLDFGLARMRLAINLAEPGSGSADTPGAGTPMYMAPEQARGEVEDERTDIHAAGLMLNEMLTGKARAAKNIAPGDLPAPLRPIVERAIAQDPAARFQTTDELTAALASVEPVRSPTRRRLALVAIAVAGVLASVSVARLVMRDSSEVAAVSSTRQSVAVLDLRNLSGGPELAWMSRALAELLATELTAGGTLRVVPGEHTVRVKQDLGLGEGDAWTDEALTRARQLLGAEYIVTGSFVALPDRQLRVDLRLEAEGGRRTSVSELGSEAEMFAMVARIGARLRRELGVPPITPAMGSLARNMRPSLPEAARSYVEGTSKLWRGDVASARPLLESAVAQEPDHPLPHAALAEALGALGYETRARDELERAYQLSKKLPREGQLLVEGQYRRSSGDAEKAAELFGLLVDFYPDRLDYGLLLADAQLGSRQPEAALATLAKLRTLPPPDGGDPRIDLAEVVVHMYRNRFAAMEEAASRAASRAEAVGARSVLAEAKLGLANAASMNQDRGRAIRLVLEAREVFDQIGDQAGAVRALEQHADLVDEGGDLSSALASSQAIVESWRAWGNKERLQGALLNQARLLSARGDTPGARARHAEALDLAKQAGTDQSISFQIVGGGLKARNGELTAARRDFEAFVADMRRLDREDPTLWASQGPIGLGNVLRWQGQLAEARAQLQQSIKTWDDLGKPGPAALSRLTLARVALLEGRADEAEREAELALREYRREHAVDSEASARAVLARAQVALGKPDAARVTLEPALGRAEKAERVSVKLDVASAAAALRLGDSPGSAVAILEDAFALAERAGYVPQQLELALELGRAEIAAGQRRKGRDRLRRLAKRARGAGFAAIARQATQHQ